MKAKVILLSAWFFLLAVSGSSFFGQTAGAAGLMIGAGGAMRK
jgi:hypothetical protein